MFLTLLNWLSNKEPQVTAIHSNKKQSQKPNLISTITNTISTARTVWRLPRDPLGKRQLKPPVAGRSAYEGFRKVDQPATDPLPGARAALFCYVLNFTVFWLMKNGPTSAAVSRNGPRKSAS